MENKYIAQVIVERLSAVEKICDRYTLSGWIDEGPTRNEQGKLVLNFKSAKLIPKPDISDLQ